MSYTRGDVALIAVSALMAAVSILVSNGADMGTWGGWFFATCAVVGLFAPWLRRQRKDRPAQKVEFDDEAIRTIGAGGRVESIRWADLAEIRILTTDEGPWVEDAFWIFENEECTSGCAVANGADGFSLLLERVQRLPGFDNAQVIRAMGCASSERFLVWRRPAAEPSPRAERPAAGGPPA